MDNDKRLAMNLIRVMVVIIIFELCWLARPNPTASALRSKEEQIQWITGQNKSLLITPNPDTSLTNAR